MPIITLTSDIGLNDFLVGAIKGQLLTADASNNIVDISHQLSPLNYMNAAYICSSAFPHFPDHTFHIVLFDVFKHPPTHFLIAYHNRQFIACPDNCILTMITGKMPQDVVAINIPQSENITLLNITGTLVKYVAMLYKGESLHKLGNDDIKIKEQYLASCDIYPDYIEGRIIFIDHFENVVVNITKEEFEQQRQGRNFKIIFTPRCESIDEISSNYASVPDDEKLAWFNSAGYLELALNKANMAGLFGLQHYNPKQQNLQSRLFYQIVRINFEG